MSSIVRWFDTTSRRPFARVGRRLHAVVHAEDLQRQVQPHAPVAPKKLFLARGLVVLQQAPPRVRAQHRDRDGPERYPRAGDRTASAFIPSSRLALALALALQDQPQAQRLRAEYPNRSPTAVYTVWRPPASPPARGSDPRGRGCSEVSPRRACRLVASSNAGRPCSPPGRRTSTAEHARRHVLTVAGVADHVVGDVHQQVRVQLSITPRLGTMSS